MKVHDQWLEALMPDPVFIAGTALQPLSCGHTLLLSRLTGWEPLGTEYPTEDIPLGLYVASRPWREAWRGVGGWRARRFLKRMAQTVKPADVGQAWAAYLERALVLPSFRRRPDKNGVRVQPTRPGAPFLLRLRLFALSQLGLGEDGFCDMGLADIVWLWLSHAEDTGEIRFSSDGELDFLEWAKDQDAIRNRSVNTLTGKEDSDAGGFTVG